MRARDSLSLIAICAALCSVVLLIFLAQAEGRAQQPPRTASEGGPYKNDLQQQMGERSQGNGQYGWLWGSDYRQVANDNMVVVIMIETPIGVENAEKIASVPGIDVIFAASTDLGNFSGHRQGEREYEALVTRT